MSSRECRTAVPGSGKSPTGDAAPEVWGRHPFPFCGVAMADDLEQLYQSTYTSVVRFLYRRVWDLDRAQDLAQ